MAVNMILCCSATTSRGCNRKWRPTGRLTSSRFPESIMSDFLIEHTPSAYKFPLLIKHLLHAPKSQAADQEIVYRDISRYTYRDLRERISRLAGAVAAGGGGRGGGVRVRDWDGVARA